MGYTFDFEHEIDTDWVVRGRVEADNLAKAWEEVEATFGPALADGLHAYDDDEWHITMSAEDGTVLSKEACDDCYDGEDDFGQVCQRCGGLGMVPLAVAAAEVA